MPGNEDSCYSCEDGGDLICCDFCLRSYHGVSLDLDINQLPDPWPCPTCVSSQGKTESAHGRKTCSPSTREKDIHGISRPIPSAKGRNKRAYDENILPSDKMQRGDTARPFLPKFSVHQRDGATFASTISDLRPPTNNKWPGENTIYKDILPPSRYQERTLTPRKKRQVEDYSREASALPSVRVSDVDERHFSELNSSPTPIGGCSRQSRGPLAHEPGVDGRSISKKAKARSHGLGSTSLSAPEQDFSDERSERSTTPGAHKSSSSRACGHSDTDQVIILSDVSKTEEAELRRWACVAHENKVQAPHPVLKYWLHPIRYASVHRIADHQKNIISTGGDYDVVDLSWDTFSSLACKGKMFRTPLLIRELFADSDDHSPCGYADELEQTFIDSAINVRYQQSKPELLQSSEAARLIRLPPDIVRPKAPNFLDLDSLSNAIKPGLTRIPRFRLLERLVRGARAEFSSQSGKQTFSTPFDVGNCQSFDILGLRGAFSGAHVDALGGTWLRNLFGTKLWMFVPQDSMTEQDWTAFSKEGPGWNPGSKARASFSVLVTSSSCLQD